MKKIILLVSLIFWLAFSNAWNFTYEVDLPNQKNLTDIKSKGNIIVSKSDNYYQDLSKTINDYLWFIFGSVALWMVLYGWILLISSNGDPADLKKANKILIWWLVWIFVSLLAYLIIRLLINLF